MKKVLILGITNLNNCGDNIISECTDYIVRMHSKECVIEHAELFRRWRFEHGISYIFLYICTGLSALVGRFLKKRSYGIQNFLFKLEHKSYYTRLIKGCDYVIMTSGMFKYANQRHSYMYGLLSQICNKYQKPLLYNAKSIAEANFSDWRCKQIQSSIAYDNVTINTRDGERGRILFAPYSQKKIKIVGDPALWIPDCYGVSKSDTSNIIGVNLIRANIFKSYGVDFSELSLFNFYCDLVSELINRGYHVRMFCNGMMEDYKLGEEIVSQLHIDNSCLLPVPKNSQEYVTMVSMFKAIVGARLHACITAVSLGIPVTGMVWDSKVQCFAESVGLSNFFLKSSELNVSTMVRLLEDAMKIVAESTAINRLRTATFDAISEFLNDRCI